MYTFIYIFFYSIGSMAYTAKNLRLVAGLDRYAVVSGGAAYTRAIPA